MRFLRQVRKIIDGIHSMSKPAYIILCGTLMLSCAILFTAFVLLICMGDLSLSKYTLFLSIKELIQLPASLLLIASIASVLVEEQVRK